MPRPALHLAFHFFCHLLLYTTNKRRTQDDVTQPMPLMVILLLPGEETQEEGSHRVLLQRGAAGLWRTVHTSFAAVTLILAVPVHQGHDDDSDCIRTLLELWTVHLRSQEVSLGFSREGKFWEQYYA
jgi:hypothetical protein